MKKQIASAIAESISTDSIIHLTIAAGDIYDAMGGVDYDDAVNVDGIYDVWGTNDAGESWRLYVTLNK